MIPLTIERDAPTIIAGVTIPAGTVVEYLGHVPGGMVQVKWNGDKTIIHPETTKELKLYSR
jgi:hypothetical protein